MLGQLHGRPWPVPIERVLAHLRYVVRRHVVCGAAVKRVCVYARRPCVGSVAAPEPHHLCRQAARYVPCLAAQLQLGCFCFSFWLLAPASKRGSFSLAGFSLQLRRHAYTAPTPRRGAAYYLIGSACAVVLAGAACIAWRCCCCPQMQRAAAAWAPPTCGTAAAAQALPSWLPCRGANVVRRSQLCCAARVHCDALHATIARALGRRRCRPWLLDRLLLSAFEFRRPP